MTHTAGDIENPAKGTIVDINSAFSDENKTSLQIQFQLQEYEPHFFFFANKDDAVSVAYFPLLCHWLWKKTRVQIHWRLNGDDHQVLEVYPAPD